jgi:hypothetical protein
MWLWNTVETQATTSSQQGTLSVVREYEMICDWDGCDLEAVGFGDVHDNLTDKFYRIWSCEKHNNMVQHYGIDFLNHVELHEVEK